MIDKNLKARNTQCANPPRTADGSALCSVVLCKERHAVMSQQCSSMFILACNQAAIYDNAAVCRWEQNRSGCAVSYWMECCWSTTGPSAARLKPSSMTSAPFWNLQEPWLWREPLNTLSAISCRLAGRKSRVSLHLPSSTNVRILLIDLLSSTWAEILCKIALRIPQEWLKTFSFLTVPKSRHMNSFIDHFKSTGDTGAWPA